ncbi:MAG: zf-HC2 domain-containing protein [Candidatus Fermentibacteraceae bacterium]|nr:zf-HC2 domain-containing protein [Candidatus Fermentibacteraceae bacterium]
MNCNEALVLIDAVIDGEATPEEEQLLQFHVNGCDSCRRALYLSRSISTHVKSLEEPVPAPRLLETVQMRLSSGSYDQSPLSDRKKTRLPFWRIAAVIPFAAALVLFIHSIDHRNSTDFSGRSIEASVVKNTTIHYAPAPVVAYSRPSSVSTF